MAVARDRGKANDVTRSPACIRPSRTRQPGPLAAFLAEVGKESLLSPEQEKTLGSQALAGDREARNRLVIGNVRLAICLARRYQGQGLDLSDLIGYGVCGLMRSARDFDPARGVKFNTYASWWIRQAIRRAIRDHTRTIRLPVYVQEKLFAWRRTARRLYDRLGREPEDGEVLQALGWPGRLAGRWAAMVRDAAVAVAFHGQDTASSDDSAPEGWDAPAPDGDPAAIVADAEWAAWRREGVADVLDRLPAREATVLRLRFGLGGEPPLTFRAIGERLGFSYETAKNVERAGLARVRVMLGEQYGEAV